VSIKNILVSQPVPAGEKSPYFELSEKHKVKVDFRQFIQVEEISSKDFKKDKITILSHSAIIMTSRTSVDHFFRICKEMKTEVPEDMKYFCTSESIALYLQKYIVYRKRKIFFGAKTIDDLMQLVIKHKKEKFLVPLSESHKTDLPDILEKNSIKYTKAYLYKTVFADLSDLSDVNYSILVFISPLGIQSLFHNFPDFKQNDTKIATFGTTTHEAAIEKGLTVNIPAPTPETPSMTMALDKFITNFNKQA